MARTHFTRLAVANRMAAGGSGSSGGRRQAGRAAAGRVCVCLRGCWRGTGWARQSP
uniref:Uncharacterized protein n=1 Tax=Arundo donax TaxID=35708 RepID=A0A0A9AMZ3_ARUDO